MHTIKPLQVQQNLNENYRFSKQAYQHIVVYLQSTTSKCEIEASPTLVGYLVITPQPYPTHIALLTV